MDDPVGKPTWQTLDISIPIAGTAMGIDSSETLLGIAGRRGLVVAQIDNPQNTQRRANYASTSTYEASSVMWNPHRTFASNIATSYNEDIAIWNVAEDRLQVEHFLKSHQRPVFDISWNHFHDNQLLSCSTDGKIILWDTRQTRKPTNTIVNREPLQVKWNRMNQHLFASSQDGEIRIWDSRSLSSSVTSIQAHTSKILGLDWSHSKSNELISTSLDRSVKLWNVESSKVPRSIISGTTPSSRAKFTPFGNYMITTPQKGEFYAYLWAIPSESRNEFTGKATPTEIKVCLQGFPGHHDVIKDVEFREAPTGDSNRYQVITWSRDQYLQIWTVDVDGLQYMSNQEMPQQFTSPSALSITSESIESNKSRGTPNIASIPRSTGSIKSGANAGNVIMGLTTPSNLQQEIGLIDDSIPNINILKASYAERTVIVKIVDSVHGKTAVMSITFPMLYPNGAPPSFGYMEGTTINTETMQMHKHVLSTESEELTQRNQPCLNHCLRLLSPSLSKILSENESDVDSIRAATSEVMPITAVPIEPGSGGVVLRSNPVVTGQVNGIPIPPSHNYGFIRNSPMVRPQNSTKLTQNSEDERIMCPRLCGAAFFGNNILVTFRNDSHLFHGVRRNHSSANISSLRDRKAGDDPFKNYASFLNHLRSLPSNHESQMRRTASEIGPLVSMMTKSKLDFVEFRDMSRYLSINLNLAESYKLSGEPHVVCQHNREMAAKHGRPDVAHVWGLVSQILTPSVDPSMLLDRSKSKNVAYLAAPKMWQHFPIYQPLVQKIFEHLKKSKDVQTTAALAVVLNEFEIRNRTASPENAYKLNWEKDASAVVSAFQPFYLASCENIRYAYSEIIYQCAMSRPALLQHRLELLKNVPTKSHIGIEFGLVCHTCGKPTNGLNCAYCKVIAYSCVVCHQSVRGLSTHCQSCGHGGHIDHLHTWFSKYEVCPSGCGCRCLEMAVFV